MTFENLESVFKKGNRPYWVLYKGNSKGVVLASLSSEDGERPAIDDSWNYLQEMINEFDDGTYSIELKSAPSASRGNPFLTFQIGEGGSPRNGNNNTTPISDTGGQPRNFLAGLDFKYFLERDSLQQQRIQDLQMELLRQEFRFNEMKRDAEQSNQPDVIGRVIGLVEKNPKILSKLFGGEEPARAAIGVLKSEKPIVDDPDMDDDKDDEFDDEDEKPGNISIDRAINCLVRLQKVFPDLNVNQLLERLTDFCEDNPKQARNILGNL